MKKILFVCLGNICRSPLAEGVFLKLISDRGLNSKYVADSCGTANYHVDEPPDPRTLQIARKYQIVISHLGRQLDKTDFENFDLILVMDHQNYQDVKRRSPVFHHHKIQLLRDYEMNKNTQSAIVPDPYSGTLKDFEEVYQILLRCCANLLEHLESR